MGRKLYYYKDSGLEVDFVIRYNGECTLVEVKAAGGNVKSTKTILKYPGKYHINSAIKLGDYNVGRTEQILTLPLYMAFFAKEVLIRFYKNVLCKNILLYNTFLHFIIKDIEKLLRSPS